MSKPIAVVGSSNMDLVIKTERIPNPGETILGGEFVMIAGGKGANQAVAAARLGAQVNFIARVGSDAFGMKMLENFAQDGINADYVIKDQSKASGVATITVDNNGENSIVVAPGANAALTPEDIEAGEKAISEADSLLLQLEVPIETVIRAAEIARKHGTRVILDPAPAQKLPEKLLKLIDILTPNESEAEILTGISGDNEESARKQAENLLASRVSCVLVTRGASGSLLYDGKEFKSFPAVRVDSVDTTAAGDCFNGSLAASLAEGSTLDQAIAFASRAAACSTTRLGAQDSLPNKFELDHFQS